METTKGHSAVKRRQSLFWQCGQSFLSRILNLAIVEIIAEHFTQGGCREQVYTIELIRVSSLTRSCGVLQTLVRVEELNRFDFTQLLLAHQQFFFWYKTLAVAFVAWNS